MAVNIAFPPSEMYFVCAWCHEDICVMVPYCTIPVLPDDWTSFRVEVDGKSNLLPSYCHREHLSEALRAHVDRLITTWQ